MVERLVQDILIVALSCGPCSFGKTKNQNRFKCVWYMGLWANWNAFRKFKQHLIKISKLDSHQAFATKPPTFQTDTQSIYSSVYRCWGFWTHPKLPDCHRSSIANLLPQELWVQWTPLSGAKPQAFYNVSVCYVAPFPRCCFRWESSVVWDINHTYELDSFAFSH